MQRHILYTAAGLGLVAGLSGCSSFLDADKAVADPNAPTVATVNQLLSGIEANIFGQQEGPVAMLICEWMQQCAGTAGRFVEVQGTYTITNNSFDGSFSSIYTAGGLLAIKDAEARADAIPDKQYKGVLEVLEAMNMLFGADNWGSIPYREAVVSTTPAFDPQLQIYDDLLALLTQAIADLNGSGNGPGAYDLVYAGDKVKWIQAAHTLRARIYLHLAEVRGVSQYALARTEAQAGISAPANDWKTLHSEATSERNMWLQFQLTSFGQDLVAGSRLVQIMKAQNDPRLPDYFGTNSTGGYGGYDVATQQTVGEPSPIANSNRNVPTFGQPIITYDENQLILAETAFRAGDIGNAAIALNNVRARYGKSLIPAPTLADIMTEKYIALFQNIEYWNDYKRTCLPVLTPALGRSVVPGRIPYGFTEVQTNTNTPPDPGPTLNTGRNANDPAAC
ncbi:MAG: SusD/RagB family nutrient-binding outer membrane lipoprotein [Gemmatimonadota bacterium]|nr:SusD/RagB family nutrient-binding outer membrane lipoprotein [Gemmatimonadota bacterium]